MEIHSSARRHGIGDDDISHALDQAVAWVELSDDPARFLLAGPDSAGNLLELVVLSLPGRRVLVIHAMKLRRSTADELFGGSR
ncbi:MAG: hypothetical protein ABIO67_07505 [Mycobacteriales bacterium]